MLDKYKYTDKEIKDIVSSIVILIDTREQNNSHILNWFNKKKIKYEKKKLDCGDYSFKMSKNEALNIDRDVYFTKNISIERKNGIDEIIGNFATERNRIEDEFLRHKGKMILLIEDEQFYDKLCNGEYRSNYNKKAALGTYHSFIERYNIYTHFTNKEKSGHFILATFYYFLRNYLK